jgi:hypothetical protein
MYVCVCVNVSNIHNACAVCIMSNLGLHGFEISSTTGAKTGASLGRGEREARLGPALTHYDV